MYCEMCGALKSDPAAQCENCLSSPSSETTESYGSSSQFDSQTNQPSKKSFPTWAIILTVALSGGLLILVLFFSGVIGGGNLFGGPVEDSELDLVEFADCVVDEGYDELIDDLNGTFDFYNDQWALTSGLQEAVVSIKSSGQDFSELGNRFLDFPHCGSLTFSENNGVIGTTLVDLGDTIQSLPTDLERGTEISFILDEVGELIGDFQDDLAIQTLWLFRFADY